MSMTKQIYIILLAVMTTFTMAQTVVLSYGEVDVDGGTVELYMQNSEPVYGFQVAVDNIDLTGASGGSAQAAGFMVSTNASGLVLGFSLTGASIPAGEGVLTVLTINGLLDDSMPICYSDATLSSQGGTPYDVDFSICWPEMEELDPPYDLMATGGDNEIALTWSYDMPSRDVVDLYITNYDAGTGQVELYMSNEEPVGGFQLDLDATFPDFAVSAASGGSAQGAGFMLSTNPSGLILGFSLTGSTIPAGEGVLCYVDVSFTGDMGDFMISTATISDGGGNPLSTTIHEPFHIGEEPLEITFNLYRDGALLMGGLTGMSYLDAGLGYSETHCYTVTAFDGTTESVPSNEDCGTTNEEPITLDPPYNLTATPGASNIDLAWDYDAPAREDIDLAVSNYNTETGQLEIYMANQAEVGGFQIDIDSSFPDFAVSAASGGSAQAAGFMLSTNVSGLILGFSLTGATIPVGEGALCYVDVTFTGEDGNFSISTATISDGGGNPLSTAIGDPYWIGEQPVEVTFNLYRDGALFMSGLDSQMFSDTGLGTGETHCYTVTAFDGETESAHSNEACATTEMGVEGVYLAISELNDNTATIFMMNSEAVAGFQFTFVDTPDILDVTSAYGGSAEAAGFMVSSNTDGTILGFSITGASVPVGSGALVYLDLDIMGEYAFLTLEGVIMSDTDGNPLPVTLGDPYVYGTPPEIPNPPANLTATLVDANNVQLNWTASAGADFYHIYRGGALIADVTETGYLDEDLDYETTYYYDVTASNVSGESDPSNMVEITTDEYPMMVYPPVNLVADPGDAIVRLSWDEPEDPGAFEEGFEGGDIPEGWGNVDNDGDGENWFAYTFTPHSGANCLASASWLSTTGPLTPDNWLITPVLDVGMGAHLTYYVAAQDPDWSQEHIEVWVSTTGDNPANFNDEVDNFTCPAGSDAWLERSVDLSDYAGENIYVAFRHTDVTDMFYIKIDDIEISGLQNGANFYAGFENAADFDQFTVRSSAADFPLRVDGDLSEEELAQLIDEYNNSHPIVTERVLTGYNVYRSEMMGGPYTMIGSVDHNTTNYDDDTVTNDVTYYYVVTAVHDDGAAESEYSNEAEATPVGVGPIAPVNLTVVPGDEFNDLFWDEPIAPEEQELAYWDGPLQNAFYFYASYEEGFAHGTRFDAIGAVDILAASVKILSAGDQYWPWPNNTHGPVRVMIFADDNGEPGALLHDEEATADGGWATIYPNIMGHDGTFYVITSHYENWQTAGDAEGYGVDGAVDFPNNMYSMQSNVWSTGDALGYGGDYMVSAMIYGAAGVQTLGYHNHQEGTPTIDYTQVNAVHDGSAPLLGTEITYPEFDVNELTRELQSYNIYYEDGSYVGNVPAGIETYHDGGLTNLVEYCYYVTGIYDEGESAPSNIACGTPSEELPNPPRNLTAVGGDGVVNLDWDAPAGGGTGSELEEGFEDGDLPADWENVDADGDGQVWFAYTFVPHSGLNSMASASWTSSNGPLTPDNYLITPVLAATGSTELSYWVAAQDPAYAQDHIEVWVSTSGTSTADFTDEVDGYTPAAGDDSWHERTVDLSGYAGQNIYLAFRHTDSYDMFYIKLDDVMVTNLAGGANFAASFESAADFEQFTVRSGDAEYPLRTAGELSDSDLDQLIADYMNDHPIPATRELDGYNLFRAEVTGGPYTFIGATAAGVQEYEDNTVVNGTTYYYVATAIYTDAPESEYSNEASATPQTFVPSPPTNLTAVAGDSEVMLNWQAPTGGTGGNWPPCPDPEFEYVDCVGTCFDNEDCANDTYDGCVDGENTWLGDGFCDDGTYGLDFNCAEYEFDFGDCGGGGECESLDEFSVEPNGCYENSNAFSLSWNAGCELTGLYYGENDVYENAFDLTGQGFDSGINFYGFGPNETYMFMVEAGDIQSPIVTATSSPDDCGGMLFEPVVAQFVKTFNQDAPTREELTGYNVYRGLVSGGAYDLIGTSETESYLDGTAENGTMYYYVVTAMYDDILESDYSNEASAMPLPFEPDPPTELTATAGDALVSLAWIAPAGGDPTGWPPCPDPTFEYVDCVGTCFNNEDCANATYDGCVDGENTWLGDGFCDDGTYGLNFDCEEYLFDFGDCEDPGECESLDGLNVEPNGCYENSNAFMISWNAGCELTGLYYGENDIYENAFDLTGMGFDSGINFYGFGPNETYMFMVEAGDIQSPIVTATSGPEDCGGLLGGPAMAHVDSFDLKHFNQGSPRNDRDVLTGFNVYRSMTSGTGYAMIAQTDADVVTYNDTDVVNGSTYYYVVSAVFDGNNESDYSNEASATPMATVVFYIADTEIMGGEELTLMLDMTNPEPVGGVQLDLVDIPNHLTLTGITGTARVPGDWALNASEQGDGEGRILAFSFQATTIAAGTGAIFELTFGTIVPPEPVDVMLTTADEVVSDANGIGFNTTSGGAIINLTVEGIEVAISSGTEPVDQGGMVDIVVSADNPVPFYGMELHISDIPEALTAIEVVPSGRIPDAAMFSFNELDGELTVLWFSLTLTPVEIGSGPLFTISYEANEDAPDGTTDLIMEDNSVFSDITGQSLFHIATNGTVDIGLPDVFLTLVQTGDDTFEVHMDNSGPVSGIQIDITDTPDLFTYADAVPTARIPGDWMVSGSENNGNFRILGFTMSGTTIAAGDGAILEVTSSLGATDFISELCFTSAIISDPGAEGYYTVSECETFYVPFVQPCTDPVNYVVEIPETGENSLVVITDIVSANLPIDVCDEIALYDAMGILNSGTCDNDLGELLVGSGVWQDEQLEIVGIGSIDNCDIGGYQLPGYVDGNPIVFKFWDASEDVEYDMEATFTAGNGTWGQLITSVTLEVVEVVTQCVELQPFMNNMFSMNVDMEDHSVENMFGDDIFIAWNDGGEYYVPSYGVNSIGDMDNLAGYKGFLSGNQTLTMCASGMAMEHTTPITWDPFMLNMFSYIPQMPMSAMEVFDAYEDDILIIANDSGEYHVPSMNVYTLTTLEPGEAYTVFLTGLDPVEFSYPMPTGAVRSAELAQMEMFKAESQSQRYDIQKTGISHAIIISDLQGHVNVGDEVVAYANGEVVGATRIADLNQPVTIAAWGGYHQYGLDLPGYIAGERIELRFWSNVEGKELRVETQLDNQTYEGAPLTSGSLTVYNMDAVPTEFVLDQNYPNPFNPSTTVNFRLPEEMNVTLNVYDLNGRLVTTLIQGNLVAGYHTAQWNGTDINGSPVSAGIYIYAIQGADTRISRKMVLMK